MSNADNIRRALRFVEENLREDIRLIDIAKEAAISKHHFLRLFHYYVTEPPGVYLRKRRLSEAARELVGSHESITGVALDYQFSSTEAFSRSFKQYFGVTPSEYRRQGGLSVCALTGDCVVAENGRGEGSEKRLWETDYYEISADHRKARMYIRAWGTWDAMIALLNVMHVKNSLESFERGNTFIADIRELKHSQQECRHLLPEAEVDFSTYGIRAYATIMSEDFVQKYNPSGQAIVEPSGLLKNLFANEQAAEKWLDLVAEPWSQD